MAKARPKTGSIVQITFWDHCEGGEDAIECTVWGKVSNVTRRAYTIQTWETSGDNDPFNKHQFNIVKLAIKEICTLVPGSQS
jgi:hypothetical protein